MGSTFLGLTIGYSGVSSYMNAINTSANNLANINTKGYSRQETVRVASEALRSYTKYGMVGTGVEITDITQVRSFYYDVKYWNNNASLGEHNTKYYYMKQIQSYYYFDEKANGVSHLLSQMKLSMEDFLDNSTDISYRDTFVSSAEGLADQINEFAIALERLQKECNDQIKVKVDQVNSIAKQIATLNKQINTIEMSGITANELRDQRALLVDQLSKIAQVEVEEIPIPSNLKDHHDDPILTGATSYRVTIGGQTLVSDFSYEQLKVVPRTEKLHQSDADGLYDIEWENGAYFNMSNYNLGGELQGLIQMRDGNNAENLKGTVLSAVAGSNEVVLSEATITDMSLMTLPPSGKITLNYHEFTYDSFKYDAATGQYTFYLTENLTTDDEAKVTGGNAVVGNTVDYMGIPYYMSQLNEFCRSFAKAFNEIHQTGVDANGNLGGVFFTGKDEVSGLEYGFADGDVYGSGTDTYYNITAKNFCVAKAITKDPSLVATASEIINGEARTDILQKLRDLVDEPTISNYTATEFFEAMLIDIAISTEDSKDMTENYETLGGVIENQRLSISGVDEDEETIEMLKYRYAYNLNSKVISIMNECYDKLINETGV